jgi:monooxygenase
MMKASWQARVAAFVVRRRVKPALADMRNIAAVRAAFGKPLSAAKGVRYSAATVGGVSGEWVEAELPAGEEAVVGGGTGEAPTLLYLHGGGFVGCSARTHRPLTAAFALQGLRVFAPDYRLAPEHPFPAAPQDALAVYRALRAAAPHSRIVVAGDSAGGNLALGLLLTLRDSGEALPAAAALFSPALDLTGASPSITLNAGRDSMFDPAQLPHLTEAYLAGADPTQPLASPLFGDMAGLPPLLLHVGEAELLRDDSIRLAQKAREAGVTVELQVFAGVAHVWQLVRQLPESRRSVRAAAAFLRSAECSDQPEELDVLIVGAGLSGIGAAVHLQRDCPDKSFALLEAREVIGGTWDLFRYPGVRSDSDMYTLGYEFKPWRAAKAIADGPAIRDYIRETAVEHGIGAHIRTQHRMVSADWSAAAGRWTVEIERGPLRQRVQMKPRFLLFCSGYYSYAQGHRPQFPGQDQFTGTLVHPQFWPAGLDYAGKQVVVIGSGATAVTLVPEMARRAAHVTMLQRSPSYVVARPATDAIAEALKRWLPMGLAYRLIRTKNIVVGQYFYRLMRKYPEQAKARLLSLAREALGPQFDVAKHFTPHYKPWDQRLCLVPDGDLFQSLREGRASVATEQIETFTPQGIRLRSGQLLPADVIVSATGLQLNLLGDAKLSLDGVPVDPASLLVYKGMMFSGLPNLANTFGYTNASWTLKADLTARYFCRVLRHLDRSGQTVFTPIREAGVAPAPFLDFTSGYVQRASAMLPQQGDRKPWRLHQNYLLDLLALRFGKVADGVMAFTRAGRG